MNVYTVPSSRGWVKKGRWNDIRPGLKVRFTSTP
jgi:hypothetical protein